MQWNTSQKSAIESKNQNILVSAGAGSGKTAVLVERILRRVLDPADAMELDKILVVTFTEAAAAEMRQRIGREIQKKLVAEPENTYYRQQFNLLGKASISTIHSFCLDSVRKYFYRLNLEPNFRIADNSEIALLRQEVIDKLFQGAYMNEDTEFLMLVEAYGETKDSKLKDTVFSLFDYARSQPYHHRWLQQLMNQFPHDLAELDKGRWVNELKEEIAVKLEEAKWYYERAQALTEQPGGPYQYADTFNYERVTVEEIISSLAASSWQQLWSRFQAFDFARLKAAKDVDEDLKEFAKEWRTQAKGIIIKLKEKFFARMPEEHLEDLGIIYPLVKRLIELTTEFDTSFSAVKREKGVLDFADLEQFCFSLLVDEEGQPTDIAVEMQSRFEEVLVDEYQDVNVIQNAILESAARQCEGGYMFMVGDVKQSIYRFRLAEPTLFMNKEARYVSGFHQEGRLISLNTNYRSRQQVINGVNYLFQQLMDARVGDIDYDKGTSVDHFLQYGELYPDIAAEDNLPHATLGRDIELHVLQREVDFDAEEVDDDFASLAALEKEALVMAQRIKQLVEGDEKNGAAKVWERGTQAYRNITYRDVVILLRSPRSSANVISQVFQQFNIPVYADVTQGYFSAQEVETMLALLRIIDNPQQDIPLAAVLNSPIGGFSAEEMAAVRCLDKDGAFYSAVAAASKEKNLGELGEKAAQFLKTLSRWRTLSRREPLSSLIWTIYRETGFLEYCAGLPRGEQRQANLRALYDRARQFDRFVFQGLYRFLHYVQRLQDTSNDLAPARALGENENVVRIMSIHKSKGLEFPVVFLGDLGKKFNRKGFTGDMLFHQEMGIGLNVVDSTLRHRYPTLAQMAVKARLERENLAEEMRVLYVALTRAKEQLILVGSVNGLEKWQDKLSALAQHRTKRLPTFFRVGAETCLDWLCGGIIRHRHGKVIQSAGDGAVSEGALDGHPSSWKVRVWCTDDLVELEKPGRPAVETEIWHKIISGQPLELEAEDEELAAAINWYYPAAGLVNKAAKLSVSELKRREMFQDDQDQPGTLMSRQLRKKPRFEAEQLLGAAEKGTALHLVMQHVDLYQPVNDQSLKEQINRMISKELLTPELAKTIPVKKIVGFFRNAIGNKILANPSRVFREQQFSLGIPAPEVYPDLADAGVAEKVLVQGVIDCFIKTGSGIILIDFKTDKVTTSMERLKEKYRVQLKLYARALTAMYNLPVVGCYLFFFDTEELLEVQLI